MFYNCIQFSFPVSTVVAAALGAVRLATTTTTEGFVDESNVLLTVAWSARGESYDVADAGWLNSHQNADSIGNSGKLLAIPLVDVDSKDSKALLQKVTTIPNTISILMTIQPARISYIVALTPGTPGNCQQYIRLINEAFGGRGGGKPDCAQGGSNYCADWEAKLNTVVEQILAM